MNPVGKLKIGGPTMPVLSKKASNIITTVNNASASIVITSPSFDGAATVSVSYPRKDLTEIVYALDGNAGESILKGQPLHQAADGKLYIANSATQTNVVGLAMSDANLGDSVEYGALGMLELPDWSILTGGEGTNLIVGSKYFLQANGSYQTALPTTGWLMQIGQGATATSLNIEIGTTPIKL
mgnify:CR=1 FL=1